MTSIEKQLGYVAPVGRLALGLIFLLAGVNKITGYSGTVGYMESHGLPLAGLLAVLTILVEILGALALITGWQGRWAALVLAAFLVPVTLIFHGPWIEGQMQSFLKNVAIFGGLLMVVANGPGPYSLEGGNTTRRTS